MKKPKSMREGKIDILLTPRRKSNALFVQQIHRVLDLVEQNKIVVIYTPNPTSFLSQLQRYTKYHHFMVPGGSNFHYIVRWYSFCNLKPN